MRRGKRRERRYGLLWVTVRIYWTVLPKANCNKYNGPGGWVGIAVMDVVVAVVDGVWGMWVGNQAKSSCRDKQIKSATVYVSVLMMIYIRA